MPGVPSSGTVRHGRARQSLGTGPCGDCIRVLWVPGPQSQYSGKIRFIEKPGIQDDGVALWLNVVLEPGSLPRSQSSCTGPSASCGYYCPFDPKGVGTREEFVLSSPRGKWAQKTQEKFRDGTVWGL